jgi:flagellar hook assembly protein FlgD
MHAGEARITFALSRTEKAALKVYDVSGRLVKTVTQRIFSGGEEHVVVWDGTDDQGAHVRNGVYFYQLQTPTYVSQKKLTVITN